MICAYCKADDADLFSPHGDPVCQRCDTGFKAAMLDHRARVEMSRNPTAGLTFAGPQKLRLIGGGCLAAAVGLGVLEMVALGRVHLVFLGILAIVGVSALGRGLQRGPG